MRSETMYVMNKREIREEVEDLQRRLDAIKVSLLPTFKPTEDDLKAHEEAMRDYKEGKLIKFSSIDEMRREVVRKTP